MFGNIRSTANGYLLRIKHQQRIFNAIHARQTSAIDCTSEFVISPVMCMWAKSRRRHYQGKIMHKLNDSHVLRHHGFGKYLSPT